MPITQPFDQHYDQYEEWFIDNRYAYLSEIGAVAHFMPKTGVGIEIGVGSGQFAQPLHIPIGIDPSGEMLRLARSKGIAVLRSVAEYLPFLDDSFDFALMVTTVCFVDDVNASFREARRIIKSHGNFIIGLVDKDSPLGQVYQAKKQENVFYREATFYSAEEIIGLLKNNHFKSVETVQTVFGDLMAISEAQPFRPGYGVGGFVVIKAKV